jgi:hypothetical protein
MFNAEQIQNFTLEQRLLYAIVNAGGGGGGGGTSNVAINTPGSNALDQFGTLIGGFNENNEPQMIKINSDGTLNVNTTVQMSRGASTATTQRVSIATDDTVNVSIPNALPAGTNTIGKVDIITQLPPGGNVLGLIKLTSTSGNETAAIKAASTAPVATDQALVVALSPNSAQPNITLANAGFQKVTDGTNTAGVTSGTSAPNNGVNALVTTQSPNVTFLKGANITGAATAVLNNNVLLATAGATSIDLLTPGSFLPSSNGNTYRSFTCQLVMGGTITGGAITFEGSNDNTNFTTIQVLDEAVHSSNYCTTAILSTNYHRYFKGACNWRYLRARISTAITGTAPTVTAYTTFSTENFLDKGIVNDVTTLYSATASTITTGGTSQFMLGAGTTQARRGFIVCNTSASNLYLNYGGAASTTTAIKVLLPNETWVSPNNIGGRAVAIFGATTGQQFTYLEY